MEKGTERSLDEQVKELLLTTKVRKMTQPVSLPCGSGRQEPLEIYSRFILVLLESISC